MKIFYPSSEIPLFSTIPGASLNSFYFRLLFLGGASSFCVFLWGFFFVLTREISGSIFEFPQEFSWFSEFFEPLYCLCQKNFLMIFVILIFSFPLGLSVAFYLNLYASFSVAYAIRIFLVFFTGTPSLFYAYFGLWILFPLFEKFSYPFLIPYVPLALLLSGLSIAFIALFTDQVLRQCPQEEQEALEALGVYSWEGFYSWILPRYRSKLYAVFFLAFLQLWGETLLFLMILGFPDSLKTAPSLSVFIASFSGKRLMEPSVEKLLWMGAVFLLLLGVILIHLLAQRCFQSVQEGRRML
jgi:ABC-type phosphate transport system permease subunit